MVAIIAEPAPAIFSVHFDGPITTNHMLTVRTISRTYKHMQSAIDRAFIIQKYGGVWKHARLTKKDYESADFLASYPREGGIILDVVNYANEAARGVIDKISRAVTAPFEEAMKGGLEEAETLAQQLSGAKRRAQNRNVIDVPRFQEFLENPPLEWREAYSARSICKEIDQIVSLITSSRLEGSSAEIALVGEERRSVFSFTTEVASRFHRIVANRALGPLVVVNASIRDLDRGNKYTKPTAKIKNLDSNKESVLHLSSDADFQELHPYHTAESVQIFAVPFIECGGFDVHAGDLYYVAVAE